MIDLSRKRATPLMKRNQVLDDVYSSLAAISHLSLRSDTQHLCLVLSFPGCSPSLPNTSVSHRDEEQSVLLEEVPSYSVPCATATALYLSSYIK